MAYYFYTIQRVDALRRQVEALGLEVPEGFYRLPLPALQKFCNGCGPERWNKHIRKISTAALSRYEAAFFVHDVCYELMKDRSGADKMLLRNMKLIFRRDFGPFWWLTKTGWIERVGAIPFVYGMVAFGGEKAYEEAQEGDPNVHL